jgi:nicotinate-nucleotide pyrophosphorylase (carboxylating)
MPQIDFDEHARRNAETLIELAFAEDLGTPQPWLRYDTCAGKTVLELVGGGREALDLTSESTIPAEARGAAVFVARSAGIVAGLPLLPMVAARFGPGATIQTHAHDGDRVAPRSLIARVSGPMRDLLRLERTALNFLQRLSGIATLTERFVSAVASTRAVILDTRKTTPGWRALEKYAVRCGGGQNHRFGLHDAVLIKDNHLAWREGPDAIAVAIARARKATRPGIVLEIEVDTLEQLDEALRHRSDIILVDNLGAEGLAEAVQRRDAVAPDVLLEASGGVNLNTVAALAQTGVDRISVGALTHSAPALDIGLDFDRSSAP